MKCNASSFFFSRLFWLFQICYDFIWILEIFAIFIKNTIGILKEIALSMLITLLF